MVTFQLHRNLSSTAIRALLPKRYHAQLPRSKSPRQRITALIFGHKRKEVVNSAMVRRTLAASGRTRARSQIAFCRNLTRDAHDLLVANGFQVLSKT
jgi:hypothetical protein